MKLVRSGIRKLAQIRMPGGWQDDLDEDVVQAMASSLEQGHILPPIVIAQDDTLVAGRNRWEAHRRLGLTEIRTDQFEFEDKAESEIVSIRENLDRKRLSPEQTDHQTARLVELLTARIEKQREAHSGNPLPQMRGAENTPKAEAVKQVAEEAGITTRAVRDRVQRDEERANPTPPVVKREHAVVPGMKEAAVALKQMGFLLRKLDPHVAELKILPPDRLGPIVGHIKNMKDAVWEATLWAGKATLATGKKVRVVDEDGGDIPF